MSVHVEEGPLTHPLQKVEQQRHKTLSPDVHARVEDVSARLEETLRRRTKLEHVDTFLLGVQTFPPVKVVSPYRSVFFRRTCV